MKLRAAHSADADDAFMFFGIHDGAVDTGGLEIALEIDDIETLNRRASAGELDLTAASFAAWPRLSEAYDLMSVGSSFGLGYGPRLVSRSPRTLAELDGRDIAVPGLMTSAALVLGLLLPTARPRPMPFTRIAAAVASGEVVAGVVIHEVQLTHEGQGLPLVADLGAWWTEETGLPLPLGATVVRRDLPDDVKARASAALAASIRHAMHHRERALAAAGRHSRGVDAATVARFVDMYVNRLTLDAGEEGRRAVDELYGRGAAAGIIPPVTARWAP